MVVQSFHIATVSTCGQLRLQDLYSCGIQDHHFPEKLIFPSFSNFNQSVFSHQFTIQIHPVSTTTMTGTKEFPSD